ncbi:MAG: hypothetical protein ACFFD2_25405 [Promethearchaeota archaeon]
MSYIERSIAWFFRNSVVKGFSILSDSRFIFYSGITLFWMIITPVSLLLHNFLGITVVTGVLKLEMAIIISFFISGCLINFVKSTKTRILLSSIILSSFSILSLLVIPIEVQYYFPVLGSIIFAGVIGVSLLISIRSFNTSWVARLMMIGKSPRKILMHDMALIINLVSVLAPIFLLVRYLQNYLIFDLILSIVGFIAWAVVMYATTRFPSLSAYDIFASILSAIYFLVLLFFAMYVGRPVFVIISDIIFIIFGVTAAVQILYSRRKIESVSVYVPKSSRSPRDSRIIFIQDEEETQETAKVPSLDESQYAIEQEMTEIRINYDGLIVMVLGLLLCFHFILLQFIDTIIGAGLIALPWQFTLVEYQFVLILFGYCLVIAIYIAFKVSYRFRGYMTKTMSERAAFLKFLTLIDKEERKRFLTKISKTVRDLLVGGITDLLEAGRRRIEEGLGKWRESLKRMFRREEEEE